MPNKYAAFTNSEREYHDDETSVYWLPKDEEEQQRMTAEHVALKELYDGNVLSTIKEALDFNKGVSILDVGCGAAIWTMDMIIDYPNCTYHGCDISDSINRMLRMDQFTFSYGNVIGGLPYADNTFDFVHMRAFVLALREKEWPISIKEVIRVTKPGVHSTCISREMNPRIAIELDKLVLENKNVTVVQSDYRECNMRENSSTAKKFAWTCIEGSKNGWAAVESFFEPRITLEQFLENLENSLTKEDCYYSLNYLAVRKDY